MTSVGRDIHTSVTKLGVKYPANAGSLAQVYNDLYLAQRWQHVVAVDLLVAGRPALMGIKPDDEDEDVNTASIVVPCSLSESLSVQLLKDTFSSVASLKRHGEDTSEERMSNPSKWHDKFIYLAITSSDSSQVYYKIGDGIVKPQM